MLLLRNQAYARSSVRAMEVAERFKACCAPYLHLSCPRMQSARGKVNSDELPNVPMYVQDNNEALQAKEGGKPSKSRKSGTADDAGATPEPQDLDEDAAAQQARYNQHPHCGPTANPA